MFSWTSQACRSLLTKIEITAAGVLNFYFNPSDSGWFARLDKIESLVKASNCGGEKLGFIQNDHLLHEALGLHGVGTKVVSDNHVHVDFCRLPTPEVVQNILNALVDFCDSEQRGVILEGHRQVIEQSAQQSTKNLFVVMLTFLPALPDILYPLDPERCFITAEEAAALDQGYRVFWQQRKETITRQFESAQQARTEVACQQDFWCRNQETFQTLKDSTLQLLQGGATFFLLGVVEGYLRAKQFQEQRLRYTLDAVRVLILAFNYSFMSYPFLLAVLSSILLNSSPYAQRVAL